MQLFSITYAREKRNGFRVKEPKMPPTIQRPEAENAYFRFSVRSEAFHAPSSFTMVMVPVTLAVVVPSAACRSAEKS